MRNLSLVAAVALLAGCHKGPVSPPAVFVDTAEGSRIVGSWSIDKLPVQTADSKRDIDAALLQAILFDRDKPPLFVFKNGNYIPGKFNTETIEIQTAYGNFSIPLKAASRISFGVPDDDAIPSNENGEEHLRRQGKTWLPAQGQIVQGAYVQDILKGRLDQPANRGQIGKIKLINGNAAMVDFGRCYVVGIDLREMAPVDIQYTVSPAQCPAK